MLDEVGPEGIVITKHGKPVAKLIRGGPADEIIAATSLVHRVPLVTRDRRLEASRVVPLAR